MTDTPPPDPPPRPERGLTVTTPPNVTDLDQLTIGGKRRIARVLAGLLSPTGG